MHTSIGGICFFNVAFSYTMAKNDMSLLYVAIAVVFALLLLYVFFSASKESFKRGQIPSTCRWAKPALEPLSRHTPAPARIAHCFPPPTPSQKKTFPTTASPPGARSSSPRGAAVARRRRGPRRAPRRRGRATRSSAARPAAGAPGPAPLRLRVLGARQAHGSPASDLAARRRRGPRRAPRRRRRATRSALLELNPPPPRFSTEAGGGVLGHALDIFPISLDILPRPAPRFRSGKQTRVGRRKTITQRVGGAARGRGARCAAMAEYANLDRSSWTRPRSA